MSATDLGTLDMSAPQVPQTMTPSMSEARKVYREFPVQTLSTNQWDVASTQAAVAQHELGQFSASSLLIDAMGQDDRIDGALDTLILGVLRLPFSFQPGKGRLAAKAQAFVESLWAKATPDPMLYDWIRWAIMAGVGLAEVVWDTSEDDWRPVGLKVWHLQHFYWREDLLCYVVLTADGPVKVEPGNGKWLLLTPGALRGHMRGAVRSIWRWWLLRDFASRDWARHSETLGKGIFRARVPSDASADSKDSFRASLVNMGADGIVELPSNETEKFELDLLEAANDHGDGFEKLMLRCEANIAVRLLGQNATSENAGQYVSRSVFSKVTLDRIDGIVGPVQDCLQQQLLRPVCEFNFDDADAAPLPKWDAEPPPDKQSLAATLLSLGQFLLNATNGGYRADPVQLSERFGVTMTAADLPTIQLLNAQLANGIAPKAPAEPSIPAPAESGERRVA